MSEKNTQEICSLIFQENLPDIKTIQERYPERDLPKGAMVTRFAPSPTGFLHIGGIFTALISERLAHQTDGVYIMRIEDTDQKRRVENAENLIRDGLDYFGLKPDEGWDVNALQGEYGPYKQSERRFLYRAFLKKMILDGLAYPCFMTAEELEQMRARQSEMKVRPGYYGVWAKWRDADSAVVYDMLKKGEPFVLRFKSPGSPKAKVVFDDLVKGRLEMQENDIDAVIMKSDGLPTYHFAHVVDDYLMRITHIIRADEWIPSTPLHLQLSEAIGLKRMKYGHLSPITKIGLDGNKRKISKRKDPEANIEYYKAKGYPSLALIEYLMNLASSGFEDWRKNNQYKSYTDYRITFKSLGKVSSPLFDEAKLRDISKSIISRMSTDEYYSGVLTWTTQFDQAFHDKLVENRDYWLNVLSIERENGKRKDVASWSEVYEQNSYFCSEEFAKVDWTGFETSLTNDEINEIRIRVAQHLDALTTPDDFMRFMREVAKDFGLASSIKELRDSNGQMRGHVGLVSQVVRYAITGRTNSPDLFQIISVLGSDEAKKRLA